MSQDAEKYLYFKVGLLKDSFALEALWQDALRYHMIDQPAQLIALRLTEYYELTKKDSVHSPANMSKPTARVSTSMEPATSIAIALSNRENQEERVNPLSSSPVTYSLAAYQPLANHSVAQTTTPAPIPTTSTTDAQEDDLHSEADGSLTVSTGVDQNAEEAADYWSLL